MPYADFRGQRPEWQFDPQVAVPDYGQWFARRAESSAAARARMRGRLDLAYGPGPRHRLDWFEGASGAPVIHAYVHGGYWRTGDKSRQSLIAEPFQRAGIPTAVLNYELMPASTLRAVVASVLDGLAWVAHHASHLGAAPQARLWLHGHSAGAHLCALALRENWQARHLRPDLIAGATLVTGIYEPAAALLVPRVNDELRLDRKTADAFNAISQSIPRPVPLLIGVGLLETPGWIDQSFGLLKCAVASGCPAALHVLAGEHHHSLIEGQVDPSHPLTAAMLTALQPAASKDQQDTRHVVPA